MLVLSTLAWCDAAVTTETTPFSPSRPQCLCPAGPAFVKCCECTCRDSLSYSCGGFDCLDPACLFNPVVIAGFPDCTGDWLLIGDGTCNAEENNNPQCGFDGGDCCPCSCSGDGCSTNGSECLDPGAGDEFYQCEAQPAAILPCSAEVRQAWVVESAAQVRALAAAVNCSGGAFEVEWRGALVVDEPIYVVDGTVLTVTGSDSTAVVDGAGLTRLFTVVNAVLHVSNVNISSGASVIGGAIAAKGSTLTFSRTNFIRNSATTSGGAVFLSDASNASCANGGVFAENRAEYDGGAMFVTGGSVVSCGASWLRNAAGDDGGAISVTEGSSLSWSDEATFDANSAATGGAVRLFLGSTVSWDAPTSFYSNSAAWGGGALLAASNSSVSWSAPTTYSNNTAVGDPAAVGGAVALRLGSDMSWSGETTYTNNFAQSSGGALALDSRSNASWSSSTEFVENASGVSGGAVHANNDSALSWSGERTYTLFEDNGGGPFAGAVLLTLSSRLSSGEDTTSVFSGNSAGVDGGAVYVDTNSSVSFSGNTSLDGNWAAGVGGRGWGGALSVVNASASLGGVTSFNSNRAVVGGGLFADSARVSWAGTTVYFNNSADAGGGFFSRSSIVSWSGTASLSDNRAQTTGGGGFLANSTLSWEGQTEFSRNSAQTGGGGAIAVSSSEVSCSGSTDLTSNVAVFGGALYVIFGSMMSWSGDTAITNCSAVNWGGGLLVSQSVVSWSGDTEYTGNGAQSGGAVFALNESSVGWTGRTHFSWNEASADGGAVGSTASDALLNPDSVLTIDGDTSFFNNTCGANGGGVALLGGLSVDIGDVDVSFIDNTAAVAGGAIFVSGTGTGPAFSSVSFVSNSAQVGGAVSMVGSGNLKEAAAAVPLNPTTFDRCLFVGNRAVATGGAIESAAGQDAFVGSVFRDNTAGTGGALRLAGTASLENCSFVDNGSEGGRGAAVSNIGSILGMDNISFSGNVFACQPGMFLGYNTVRAVSEFC